MSRRMVGRYLSYLLLLVPMAIGVLLLAGVHRRRRPAGAAPACGKCGYDVRGLPGAVCPECGSDLRVVGIRRPGEVEPLGGAWRLAAWTAFSLLTVLGPAAALWGDVQSRWLMVHDVTRHATFYAPRSRAYRRIHVEFNTRSYGGGSVGANEVASPQRMTVTLGLNDGTVRTMDVTAPAGRGGPGSPLGYHYRDSAGRTIQSADDLHEETLEKWMADAGVRTADPAVGREIDELLLQVRIAFDHPGDFGNSSISSAGPFLGSGFGGGSSVYPARWSESVPFAAALLVWGAGLPYMLRRRTPGGS